MSIELGPPFPPSKEQLPDHLRDVSLDDLESTLFGYRCGKQDITERDMDILREWEIVDGRYYFARQEWYDRWYRQYFEFKWNCGDLCCQWYSVVAMLRDMPDVASLNGGMDDAMEYLMDVSGHLMWAQATGMAYDGNGIQSIYEDWMETQIAPNGRALA